MTEFLDGGDVYEALAPDRLSMLTRHPFGGSRSGSGSGGGGSSVSFPGELEFGWSQRLRVALHASRALAFVHGQGTIHRDVKASRCCAVDTSSPRHLHAITAPLTRTTTPLRCRAKQADAFP